MYEIFVKIMKNSCRQYVYIIFIGKSPNILYHVLYMIIIPHLVCESMTHKKTHNKEKKHEY